MPPRNSAHASRVISLKQAVYWIAFDSISGPTGEQMRSFKEEAERLGSTRLPISAEALRTDAEERAWEDLSHALREGDLAARGRFSNRKIRQQWRVANPDEAWEMHGTTPVLVATTLWGEGRGEWREGMLTFAQGQYIDLTVSEFILRCLWSDPSVVPETPSSRWQGNRPALRNAPTGYLSLINKAVDTFWIDGNEPTVRKPEIVAWIKGHQVDGQPISENLAQAIGTMILPMRLRKGGIEKLKWNR